MTETAKIVEVAETGKAFLSELQNNTVAAQLLITELTEAQSCDYSTVNGILQQQSMKAAFAHLQKLGPSSSYANRFWQNFWVNSDSVTTGRTLNTLGSDTHTESGQMTRNRFVTFSEMIDRGEVTDGATLDPDFNGITINQTGVWLVSWCASFGFYPAGYGNLAYGGMTTNPLLTSKVRTGCGVVITEGATQRYAAFGETNLTGKHLKEGTPKVCSGTEIVKINQGSKLRLHWARSGGIGTFLNGATSIKEVLGMRKMQNTMTGGIPNRDTSNFLSLVRLS